MFAALFAKICDVFGQSSKNLIQLNSSVIAFETPFTGWLMFFPSYYLLETFLLLLLVFIGDSISNSSGCSVTPWLIFDCTCPMSTLRT
ncbi:hypothetical protein SORBI_3005G086250 [Sorghum bicolor]|uniref:Uncharacterized protein n=1 Tax=Sorghum bicolor TaxID=4558 RepID=A0A1Z5RI04_SORBI|nr:hypothetical protein SORBI_3005G086250 [Sorghum bicolor]